MLMAQFLGHCSGGTVGSIAILHRQPIIGTSEYPTSNTLRRLPIHLVLGAVQDVNHTIHCTAVHHPLSRLCCISIQHSLCFDRGLMVDKPHWECMMIRVEPLRVVDSFVCSKGKRRVVDFTQYRGGLLCPL
ncbi:hypothetical protein L226DRAFT_191785 [Lentinus tigrinus ALCF2SS1-7]|uniref:uncharacterized protein n=1 Tax=Lentinus tigrinus ALCF2SS1-7 TaxID=1328758 RepID=UPI0011663D4A|nr:hypothetical protein L226DRAFT_191785 [Lentinus tigrinus ALCF2SS1-7]